jgi:hypothetical protein
MIKYVNRGDWFNSIEDEKQRSACQEKADLALKKRKDLPEEKAANAKLSILDYCMAEAHLLNNIDEKKALNDKKTILVYDSEPLSSLQTMQRVLEEDGWFYEAGIIESYFATFEYVVSEKSSATALL